MTDRQVTPRKRVAAGTCREEHVRHRVTGIDSEFRSDGRRDFDASVEPAEQIESIDSREAGQRTGIGHNYPCHRAVLSSPANSSGG